MIAPSDNSYHWLCTNCTHKWTTLSHPSYPFTNCPMCSHRAMLQGSWDNAWGESTIANYRPPNDT